MTQTPRRKRRHPADGTDIVAAMTALGANTLNGLWTLAAELDVTVGTVRRWRRGACRPSARSLEALHSYVSDMRSRLAARNDIRAAETAVPLAGFQRAHDALMTDEDRRWEADMIERMNADLDALSRGIACIS